MVSEFHGVYGFTDMKDPVLRKGIGGLVHKLFLNSFELTLIGFLDMILYLRF